MATHVAGDVTSLVFTIEVTRADATVLRFTSADRDLVVSGQTFLAAPGFKVSNIACTEGLGVDQLRLTLLTTTALAKADVLAGRWDGALVKFNEVNAADTSMGVIPWPSYRISDKQPIIGGFELELRDLRQLLKQDNTLFTGKTCQNRLGDARCTKALGAFTFSFTVTSVTSRSVFTASGLAQAADYFGNGLVTFASGIYAGLPQRVQAHASGGVITLAYPLITNILVGDTGSIVAGCWGRIDDCRVKFSNILNMRAPGVHAPLVSDMVNG